MIVWLWRKPFFSPTDDYLVMARALVPVVLPVFTNARLWWRDVLLMLVMTFERLVALFWL